MSEEHHCTMTEWKSREDAEKCAAELRKHGYIAKVVPQRHENVDYYIIISNPVVRMEGGRILRANRSQHEDL